MEKSDGALFAPSPLEWVCVRRIEHTTYIHPMLSFNSNNENKGMREMLNTFSSDNALRWGF